MSPALNAEEIDRYSQRMKVRARVEEHSLVKRRCCQYLGTRKKNEIKILENAKKKEFREKK